MGSGGKRVTPQEFADWFAARFELEIRVCVYCGTKFPLSHDGWENETVCSQRCHDQFVDYLNGGGL